jgi:ribonuclease G
MPKGRCGEALAEDMRLPQQALGPASGSDLGVLPESAARVRRPALPLRAVRDLMRPDVEKVKVDSRETFERCCDFAAQFMPGLAERDRALSGRASDLRPVRGRG